jgi:hypothetical protein
MIARITSVTERRIGAQFTAALSAGSTTLPLDDTFDFDLDRGTPEPISTEADEPREYVGGGTLELVSSVGAGGSETVSFTVAEVDDVDVFTLTSPTTLAYAEGDWAYEVPSSIVREAQVQPMEQQESIEALVPYALWDRIPAGVRETALDAELVECEVTEEGVTVKDVIGQEPTTDGGYLTPGTVPPDATTDGLPPEVSPAAIVQPGYLSLFVNWSPVVNHDPVTYAIYLSTASGFTPGASTFVGETQGTMVVLRTLSNGTPLAKGTTYYVRIVARDIDGAAAPGAQGSGVPAGVEPVNIDGQITSEMIVDLSAAKVIGSLINAKLAASDLTGQLTDEQIAGIEAAKVVGDLVNAKLAAADITGQLTSGQLASLDATKVIGDLVNAKLASADITGQLTSAQIASLDGAKVLGDLVNAQLDAAKLSGELDPARLAAVRFGGGNMITNSSAENSVTPTQGWGTSSASRAIVDPPSGMTAVHGSKVVEAAHTSDASASILVGNAVGIRPPVRPGATYTASHYFRRDPGGATARSVRTSITWVDASGSIIVTNNGPTKTETHEWQRSTFTLAAPAGAVWAYPRLIRVSGVTGEKWYIDAVQFEEANVASAYAPMVGEILPLTITSDLIGLNAITNTKIADDAISTPKLQAGSIDTLQLKAGAVSTDQLAANAVTAAKILANEIGAAHIKAGEINAGHLAANSVTSAKILAGEILAAHIKAGEINTGHLAANSITSAKILAGEILASHIKAGEIGTDHLAANAVTAAKILAGEIGTAHLAANSITSAKILAGEILAQHIKAGEIATAHLAALAITADKIAANAVTASKILAGEINAGHLATNSVTSAKIAAGQILAGHILAGEINAGHLGAGSVTTAKLAAGSVVTSKLAIGTWENLVPNGGFEHTPLADYGWTVTGSRTTGTTSRTGNAHLNVGTPAGIGVAQVSGPIEMVVGQSVYAEAWSRRLGGTTAATTSRIGLAFYDSTDTQIGDVVWGDATGNSTTYAARTVIATAPAATASMRVHLEVVTSDATSVRWDDVYARRRMGGELIVDGSITATKIGANEVQTQHLLADSVVADKIRFGEIIGEHLSAMVVLSTLFTTGEPGQQRVMFGSDPASGLTGIRLVNQAEETLVDIPVDGPATFGGEVIATTLRAIEKTVLEGSVSLAQGGTTILENSVADPNVGPVVENDPDMLKLSGHAGGTSGGWFAGQGPFFTEAGGPSSNVHRLYTARQWTNTGYLEEFDTNGVRQRVASWTLYSGGETLLGVVRTPGTLWVLVRLMTQAGGELYWRRWNQSDLTVVSGVTNALTGITPQPAQAVPAFDGTNLVIVAHNGSTSAGLTIYKATPAAPTTLTSATTSGRNYTTVKLRGAVSVGGELYVNVYGDPGYADGAVHRFDSSNAYVSGSDFGGEINGVAYNTSTSQFFTFSAGKVAFQRHLATPWPSPSKLYLAYVWTDGAGTPKLTRPSPIKQLDLSLYRRTRVKASFATPPAGVAGLRVYALFGTSAPSPDNLRLQTVTLTGLTLARMSAYNASGTLRGSGANDFGSGVPHEMKSAAGGLYLRGDGTTNIAPALGSRHTNGVNPVTSLTLPSNAYRVAMLIVPCRCTLTGIGYWVGATAGGAGSVRVALWDAAGALLRSSAAAAQPGSNTFHRLAFSSAVTVEPGTYYAGIAGALNTTGTHIGGPGFGTGLIPVGTFNAGTGIAPPDSITPPTDPSLGATPALTTY